MGIALLALARDRADIGTMPLVVDTPSRAPALIAFLESRDIAVSAAQGDLEAAVRDRHTPIALVDRRSLRAELRQRTARPGSHCSTTRRGANRRAAPHRMRTVLADYPAASATRGWCFGASRLPRSPRCASSSATSLPQPREPAGVLATMPIFILLAAFVGGTSVAADLTAGERERGSLESLLLHPVDRLSLVAGQVAGRLRGRGRRPLASR